jgi:hypothetical protein
MRSFAHRTRIQGNRATTVRPLLDRVFALNRPLIVLGAVMLLTFLATVVTGVPAWVKPAKFAISISIYAFTFAWLLGFVEGHSRLLRLIANVTVVSIIVEMAAIVTQAARGTTSHFNISTPFNFFVWMSMGAFIVLVWTMNLLLAILLIRQRMTDRAFAWSIRLGVLISFVGMAVAFLMVRPTPQQAAAIAGGNGPRIVGAHTVGIADGGPGLPFIGWSTVGGDLRVGHFLGLHALQVLPLLGWLLSRRRGFLAFLSTVDRLALVWTGGLAYLGLVAIAVWQAMRGQSVIGPDAATLTAISALAAGVATSIAVIVARIWNRNKKACVFASAVRID